MRCLEEVISSHRKEDFLRTENSHRGVSQSELEVVRIALVRNLARAMLAHGRF